MKYPDNERITKNIIDSRIIERGNTKLHVNKTMDRYMSLSYIAESSQSNDLIEAVCQLIMPLLDISNGITKKLRNAVGAVLADLLSVANMPDDMHLYRPRGVADFKGQRIGYRPCIDALDGLMELDFLHRTPGIWLGSRRTGEGDTTRYRAKSDFLELVLRYGITPGNWRSHFTLAPRPTQMPHPVIVRGKREFWDKEDKGRRLPIVRTDPAYIAAVHQVDRINRYMAPQVITGCNHDGFVRIFNHGDQAGFNYNMGGRLYSKASGSSYQNIEKHNRHYMSINGDPVVELDLRASFLTIIYALKGIAPDPDIDPYTFGSYPRDVVKAWINMTLGYDRFHSNWAEATVEKMLEDKGIDLRQYNINEVRASVIEEHPILQGWPKSSTRWQHLQYLESCAIIDAVEALGLLNDVAAFPLHDALLIGNSKVDIAKSVLSASYHNRIGVVPVLSVKDCWPEKVKHRLI